MQQTKAPDLCLPEQGYQFTGQKFRQYQVMLDGSGRLSTRNRRHLQKIMSPDPCIQTHSETQLHEKSVDDIILEQSNIASPIEPVNSRTEKHVIFEDEETRKRIPILQQPPEVETQAEYTTGSEIKPVRQSTRKRILTKRYPDNE